MDVKLEQRENFKFYVKLGKSEAETFEMIQRAYGNEAMSRTRCFEWHAFFKRGRTSLEDDERSGRPSTSSTPTNVVTILQLMHEDRRKPFRTLLQSSMCHTEQCRQFSRVIWTCTALLQSSCSGSWPSNGKSIVLQFVKSFVRVPWVTHPSCRGSSLGTRGGSTGMIPILNNCLRNARTQDPQDRM
jgi:hypothetical protein